MTKKKSSIVDDMVDVAIAAPIAGVGIQMSEAHIPAPLGRATGSMIGLGLTKGVAEKLKEKDKDIF